MGTEEARKQEYVTVHELLLKAIWEAWKEKLIESIGILAPVKLVG